MFSFVRVAFVTVLLHSIQTITKIEGLCGVVNIYNQLMLDTLIFNCQGGVHFII